MQIEGFSISPQQARLWQLNEQGPFRACAALEIKGPLDQQRLRQSLAHLTANHEILRTAFVVSPGVTMPLQVIGDEAGLETIDQTSGSWQELLEAETGVIMNPEKPILPRVAILPQDSDHHVLLFSMPSLCCDGWSLNRLAVEVGTLYHSLASDDQEEAEPVQYTDYADWLEELEEEQEGARLFWEERKSEMAQQSPLASFQQADAAPYSVARIHLTLPSLEKINRAAQAMNISAQALWLASWQFLLARFGNQPQITTAVAFHGRSFDELETAFGAFTRFLPLTSHIDSNMAFSQFAQAVAAEITRFQDRQDFFKPDKLNPAMAFEWQQARPPYQTGNLSFRVLDVRHHMEPFACKLQITETPNGFLPELIYNGGQFSESFVSRLGDHLLFLLGNLMENPDRRMGELATVPDEERSKLLEWTLPCPTLYDPVHRLFEARTAETPNRIALVYQPPEAHLPEERLSYEELNSRANRLARHLKSLGAGPDRPVGICLGRGVHLIVSMLAALKTGSGYIPLDPRTPDARLLFMARDSGVAVLITGDDHAELDEGIPKVLLSRDEETINALASDNLDVRLYPENLVYGIYTSGSTGKPKAVGIQQGNLLHYLNGVRAALSLEDGASYAVVSTLAADLGNTAIYPALCLGGTLHLLSDKHITDAHQFGAYFQGHEIDCLKITPSHLASLMSMGVGSQVLPRKKLVLGGEATRPQLLAEIAELAPNLEIYNHYGPSETTIGTLTYQRRPETGHFPMGKPIPHSAVYLLTAQLEPVPAGSPGEAYIAGDGVTRGYLNKPGLTAERFIPNPHGAKKGQRMYRTGDLARSDERGNLIFMGRVDHQVKLRGFRIELGEIEALLQTLEGVRHAVVLLKTGASGDDRLVAYVERNEKDIDLNPHHLRAFLSDRLSDYMVPAAYVVLDRFPLNPNGKIDRKALPEPVASSADHAAYVEPATESEILIAQIWKVLLETDKIGAHDQFFELGGHSFLAIRTLAALKEKTGLDLEVRSLLENPRLTDFAGVIDAAKKAGVIEQSTFDPRNLPFPLEVRHATLHKDLCCLWFGDTELLCPIIANQCPVDQLPQYILEPGQLAAFDQAADKNQAALELLNLKKGSEDPEALMPLFKDQITATRLALNEAYKTAELKDRYLAGHHPSWFVKRGIRTLNFAEFHGTRGASKERVLAAVNGFIQRQGLLRAVLTREDESTFFFREVTELQLTHIPEFDLSGYHPETRQLCLNVIHYLLGQDLLSSDPPLDTLLFNLALIRVNHTEYRVLFALDHIIADYEAKHVVRRYLQHLDEGPNGQPPTGDVEHYRSFPLIQAAPPENDPKFQQIKEHPYFLRYRDPVLELQKKYPIGEPIVFSKPWHLEIWLEANQQDSEDNYLGHGLAMAGQILCGLFNLPGAPLRVLVSRRYFSGYNFYNTIGDFHDSVPVYLPSHLTNPNECFQELRNTDQAYAEAGLDLSSLGREPDIYHTVYKSPFNFNFVGEISEQHEAGMLAGAGVFSFVSYPIFAYHTGNKLGLIFYHGMEEKTLARVEGILKSLPNKFCLKALKGRDDHAKSP